MSMYIHGLSLPISTGIMLACFLFVTIINVCGENWSVKIEEREGVGSANFTLS